mmetsp:Transcript_8935/g.27737  ORF Transcript_8935/g.27737 Transcript_8935/m.27737 type:complete len:267 (-) Transcript_8935:56-856(-)
MYVRPVRGVHRRAVRQRVVLIHVLDRQAKPFLRPVALIQVVDLFAGKGLRREVLGHLLHRCPVRLVGADRPRLCRVRRHRGVEGVVAHGVEAVRFALIVDVEPVPGEITIRERGIVQGGNVQGLVRHAHEADEERKPEAALGQRDGAVAHLGDALVKRLQQVPRRRVRARKPRRVVAVVVILPRRVRAGDVPHVVGPAREFGVDRLVKVPVLGVVEQRLQSDLHVGGGALEGDHGRQHVADAVPRNGGPRRCKHQQAKRDGGRTRS